MDYEFKIPKNQSSLPLREILKTIDGENYDWTINSLYAAGKLPGDRTMLQLEDEIRACPNGLPVSWDFLTSFADHVEDIYDLLLFAKRKDRLDVAAMKRRPSDDISLSVELFDSTFWLLKTSVQDVANILSRLKLR
jgi:hypothetical protein